MKGRYYNEKTLTITSLVAAMSMSVFAAQPTQTHVNQAFVQEATQTKANAPVDNQTVVPATTANTAASAVKAPVADVPAKATKTTAPAVKTTVASAPAKATKTTAPAVKPPVASAPAKEAKAPVPTVKAPVATTSTKSTPAVAPKATTSATSATRDDAETMDTAHAMNLPNADEVRVVKHDTGLAVKDVEDATAVNKSQAPKEELAKKATSANKVTK